jgi:DNA-binding beta-propeller fold protein YncE
MRRFAIAALFAAGMAACSGGVSPMLPPSRQAPNHNVLARLTINVPHRTRAHRRGRYVSPATASLAYTVDGVTQTPVTISPSSPNCKVNGPISYLRCSVNLSIKPGNHTFSFTTKDAQANVLSANTHITFKVVAGASNTIPVTLGGVASSFSVYPPAVPQVVAASGGGYTIYGKNALQFSIVPVDADGNAILGPGAPQPVVSAAPPGTTMQTPAPTAPNLWTFTSTYTPTDPSVAKVSSISVFATPVPNSGGTTLDATIPLSLYVPWVYMTSESGGSDAVVVTDESGNTQSVSGSFPNLSSVNGIAYDPHNGFLYAENGGTSNVTVYDLQGRQQTVAGSFQNGGPDQPEGIVFDPRNDWLYVTYFSSNSVSAFDEQGRIQATSGSFPGLSSPIGIAYDGADQLLYIGSEGGSVSAYDEQGNQKTLSGGFPNVSGPAGLAYDPTNAFLYVANTNFGGSSGTITVYDTQGNQQTVSGSFPGLGTGPTAIAHDPHNDWFYVGDCSGAPARAFDANGTAQSFSAPTTYVPGIAIVP